MGSGVGVQVGSGVQVGAIVGVGDAAVHPMTTAHAAANPMPIASAYGRNFRAYGSQGRIHARLPPPRERCVNSGEESQPAAIVTNLRPQSPGLRPHRHASRVCHAITPAVAVSHSTHAHRLE